MLQKLKNSISSGLKNLGHLVDKAMIPIVVFGMLVAIMIFSTSTYPEYKKDKVTKATVMITRLTSGGGTGVIYKSSKDESQILTNVHVCEAVEKGGVVTTSWGEKHLVTKMVKSEYHDVCMVYVQTDLGVNSDVANKNPVLYSNATVSGHPNLLPVTITRGVFSSKQIIQVFMGVRPCTEEELNSETAQLCLFFGGVPILKTFDARLVTATIMPGSSGSAVYTANGEIGGLVFAGSGQLSYAYTVPFEYVSNFVNNELPEALKYGHDIQVDYSTSLIDLIKEQQARKKYNSYISEKCKAATVDDKIGHFCKVIVKDLEFKKEL